ncbi:MAG: tRNA (N6-isopentenyl adenosine(37)-C2)-methylthiotransferase MiaB [Spirochaetia bacterium]|jgi:tRNA-2-methylthio-N6-dimethylallyladenosine synthase|nr:tRNA (N6-isopentenyl adenosine(37)-C2)-methylthiotransferase MiaB [Spirochaetia bacterium]
MRYFIETYGCQMNVAESAALETQFLERGWTRSVDASDAHLVLINTCSVRITAETRVWGRIAHYAALKRRRDFTLVVTGCMAERLKDAMRQKAPGIDYVLGTFQKAGFGLVIDAVEKGLRLDVVEETPRFVFARSHRQPGAYSSFVPIMHGCNNFCSYCIVPYVRGREISRSPEAVMAEIHSLAESGVREITLLGQNVNSYHWSESGVTLDFAGLLTMIATEQGSSAIGRVRFVSSHPKDLSMATIEAMASSDIFSRHIHLCVQHGSDRVLEAMNRKYSSSDYRALVKTIRARLPGATISTDILVGFPGETEDDVEQTIELMREIRFAYAFMYHYNPREGTPAARMEQVPDAVKKARLARVIALQKEITKGVMSDMLGSEATVLIEAVSKRNPAELLAKTDQDMMVVFPASSARIGSVVRVRLNALRGTTFRAEEVG